MDHRVLGAIIVIFVVLALGGLGYIYVFSPFLGGLNYSPIDSEQGIQMSPSTNCQEICVEGVFMGCEKDFQDLTCGVSCKGIISGGPRKGELPIVGSTLCSFTECVCN
jgi:hypothetical protein